MNLELIPPVLAILLSAVAFGVAWLVGLSGDVPAHAIALRATIAAAVFWVLGLGAGKLFLRCVYTAVSEQMAQRQSNTQQQQGGNGNGNGDGNGAAGRRPKG